MQGIIIKDDRRYDYTQAYLEGLGYEFCGESAKKCGLDFVIFPFMGIVDEGVYNDGFFADLSPDSVIFSGVPNGYLKETCERYNLDYYAMASEKSVQKKNAVPTSEGVISHLITEREETVCGSRILVIGYGACGSDLAKKLKSLGASVCVLVRNKEKENAAQKDSVTPIYIDRIMNGKAFDIIINTVPSIVLTNEMLGKMRGTLFIDIASKPHGFDIEHAKKVNEKSAILPGIPGKYAVKTAGIILGEFIDQTLRGKRK